MVHNLNLNFAYSKNKLNIVHFKLPWFILMQ